MTVICFVNQKGGVGKTASVVNIGAGLAKLNKRVLLVDLDPQESLSYWLGVTEPAKTIYHVFDGKEQLDACKVRHREGFDVVASHEMLATINPDTYQLKLALREQSYDYVLLDCSPTLGMTTIAALTAADWVVIPVCLDLLSIKGMSQLLGTIDTIREQTNAGLTIKGVIATRYSKRKKIHQDVLEQIQYHLKDIAVFTVRENISVSESPSVGKSVLGYKPKSTGAEDYLKIARRLIDD